MDETETAAPATKFKTFRPKLAVTLAYQHVGSPEQVNTAHGTETVEDGDYVVQVGSVKHTEIVPPRDGKPGATVESDVPLLEPMKKADFEALYQPA